MISTIQIHKDVKEALNRMKAKNETYEEVIVKMMKLIETEKRQKEKLLIEGCKAMVEENLKITGEFEKIEDLGDWQW